MRTSFRDYLHALNVMGEDVDVSVDGTGFVIAVCPPIALTPDGEKEFGEVLDTLYVDVEEYGNCVMSDSDEDYDLYDEYETGKLQGAIELLASLAGYCPSSKFDKWFEGEDAKMI